MKEMATQGVTAIERYRSQDRSGPDPGSEIRALQSEARTVLADAGHPGEAVWRALSQAHFGFEAYGEPPESGFWDDLLEQLAGAIEALDRLLATGGGQEADFRIVG
jgi:hypothetical protein